MHPSQVDLGLHFPNRKTKFFDMLVVLSHSLRSKVRYLQARLLEGFEFIVILKGRRVSLGVEDGEDPKFTRQSFEGSSLPKERSVSDGLR